MNKPSQPREHIPSVPYGGVQFAITSPASAFEVSGYMTYEPVEGGQIVMTVPYRFVVVAKDKHQAEEMTEIILQRLESPRRDMMRKIMRPTWTVQLGLVLGIHETCVRPASPVRSETRP